MNDKIIMPVEDKLDDVTLTLRANMQEGTQLFCPQFFWLLMNEPLSSKREFE